MITLLVILLVGLAVFSVGANLLAWFFTLDETLEEKQFRERLSGKR